MNVSEIISKLTPIIVEAVERNRVKILASVGGWQAWALSAVWHIVVAKVLPYAIRVGVQIALTVAAPLIARWLESLIADALAGRSLVGGDHLALAENAVTNLTASVGALDSEVVAALRTYGVDVSLPQPDPSRFWNGGQN